jgi:REP element-mobilizing transposase RayT
MNKFDPQKHHRHSIRLKGYDYSQEGAYYVTIVTWRRDFLFGEIVNQEMMLSKRGQIADACWREIPNHFPHVELGAYVIMPNHMHGIIFIKDGRRGAIYRAPTDDANIEKFGEPVKGSLPTIIRTYKAAVTRLIGRELNETGIWQRNYYDHIIRDEKDLQNKTDYIEANPRLWDEDDENPLRTGVGLGKPAPVD